MQNVDSTRTSRGGLRGAHEALGDSETRRSATLATRFRPDSPIRNGPPRVQSIAERVVDAPIGGSDANELNAWASKRASWASAPRLSFVS